jgi:Flp pilus assembly protein protease CpaA
MTYSTYLLVIIALSVAYGSIAIIQDIKKREVANWINFSFVIALLSVLAFESVIESKASIFILGLLALGIYFGLANLFYYGKIFAGGDAKLLIGLGIAVISLEPDLGLTTFFSTSFSFLINIFFIGAIYGIVWAISLFCLNKEKKKIARPLWKDKKIFLRIILFLIAGIISYFAGSIFLFVLLASLIVLIILMPFLKSIEECCLVKSVPVENLMEGDWIALPLSMKFKGKIIKIMPKWDGLSINEIKMIKSSKKIKKIRIKEGIPFTPALLAAFIAYLLVGNLLEYIILLI